jgi:tetratricopeptide (TPR) repeat protein
VSFATPGYFMLLLVVLIMAAAGYHLWRWRRRARLEFAGPQAATWPSSAFTLRLVLVLLAAVLIVTAAARPQWGSRERLRQSEGSEFVIALDVSQSMQGTDVQPTRLKAAQEAIKRLVAAERGSRIGLVLFAGSAAVRSPLTTDAVALSELVDRASRETTLTRAGSDIGGALALAQLLLVAGEDGAGKAVLVVSDGEDHTGAYADKAKELRDKGIAVFTVGVGTARGSQLFDTDARGQTRPKLDLSGRPVVTRLDEAKLRAIAQAGGGRYVQLDAGAGSILSLSDDLSRLDQTSFGLQTDTLPNERYQAFVIAALILLVESWALPASLLLPAAARLRRMRPHPGLAIALAALFIGACGGGDSLREENAAANRQFVAEDYDSALKVYESLLAQRPDLAELSLNAGNTLHRLGNYDRAISETQRALPPTKAQLGAETYYSLGNHYLAQSKFEEAYEAYKSALLLDPKDQDAKHNLELTLRLFYASVQPGQAQMPGGIPAPQAGQPSPEGQPSGNPGQGEDGQPAPGQQPSQPGPAAPNTPQSDQPSTSPPPPDAPGSDAQRSLQDALRGLDKEISFEEALRILNLLRNLPPPPAGSSSGTPTGPDY